jgi:hypothetical protein
VSEKISVKKRVLRVVATATAGVTPSNARQAQRKQFFFEKKNQKTFACLVNDKAMVVMRLRNKSFLVLFFKKELLRCYFSSMRTAAPTGFGFT